MEKQKNYLGLTGKKQVGILFLQLLSVYNSKLITCDYADRN